jgi:hypothetical protein
MLLLLLLNALPIVLLAYKDCQLGFSSGLLSTLLASERTSSLLHAAQCVLLNS